MAILYTTGRVGLTVAAQYPSLIRRLSLTGVPYLRPPSGIAILDEWRQLLSLPDHRRCGESLIRHGYSPDFLSKIEPKMDTYIDMILASNNMTNVYHLIALSHPTQVPHNYDQYDVYSIQSCIQHIQCNTQVIAATYDTIAGYQPVKDLYTQLQLHSNPHSNLQHEFIEMNNGHLAPFEDPGRWRKCVLDFCNTI